MLSIPRFCFTQNHSPLDCSAINFRLTLSEQRTCTFNFCPAAISKSSCCAKEACGGLRIFDCDAKCSLHSNPMTGAPISRRVPALIVPSAVTKARLKRRLVGYHAALSQRCFLPCFRGGLRRCNRFLDAVNVARSAHLPKARFGRFGATRCTSWLVPGMWVWRCGALG